MNQKNISGWNQEKQKILNEIKEKTQKTESEIIREALSFYLHNLVLIKKFEEIRRANKRGRPKKWNKLKK